MKVKVVDFKENPLEGRKVIFRSDSTGKTYSKVTNKDGTFKMLLPKGQLYKIYYEVFGKKRKARELNIPDKKGDLRFQFKLLYRIPRQVTLDDIHFNSGKAKLRESSYDALSALVKTMKQNEGLKVEIAGHTDSKGSDSTNQKLSERRAQAVVDYLVEKGIDRERLKAKGYGERAPIASNDTPEGRQKNRRTEIRVLER